MADITTHLQESIRAACRTFESLQELAEPMAGGRCDGRMSLRRAEIARLRQWRERGGRGGFLGRVWLPFCDRSAALPGAQSCPGRQPDERDRQRLRLRRSVCPAGGRARSAGDVLVAITTSGNSKNILRALEEGKSRGLTTVALLGRSGGPAKGMAESNCSCGANRPPASRRRTSSCSTSSAGWSTRACPRRDEPGRLPGQLASRRAGCESLRRAARN